MLTSKLDYQLADPYAYILNWVQSAVAGGASIVHVNARGKGVVVDYDGATWDEPQLRSLFLLPGLLGPQPSQAYLTVGLKAAPALGWWVAVSAAGLRTRFADFALVEDPAYEARLESIGWLIQQHQRLVYPHRV